MIHIIVIGLALFVGVVVHEFSKDEEGPIAHETEMLIDEFLDMEGIHANFEGKKQP